MDFPVIITIELFADGRLTRAWTREVSSREELDDTLCLELGEEFNGSHLDHLLAGWDLCCDREGWALKAAGAEDAGRLTARARAFRVAELPFQHSKVTQRCNVR